MCSEIVPIPNKTTDAISAISQNQTTDQNVMDWMFASPNSTPRPPPKKSYAEARITKIMTFVGETFGLNEVMRVRP
jgi:hypothetical protein